MQQLETEMEELRKQIAEEKANATVVTANTSDSTPEAHEAHQRVFAVPDGLPRASWTPPVSRSVTPLYKDGDDLQGINLACSAKQYSETTLEPDVIGKLFTEYVKFYHPILPVVDVSQGPEALYNLSIPLFWSIMAVASRRCFEGVLLTKLSTIQKSCLAEVAVSPVIRNGPSGSRFNLPSVYAVQAFLICTLWPLPTSSINADSSWNTSAIAYSTAMRAGLHFPGYERDFSRISRSSDVTASAKKSEQCATWLATTAVAQLVAGMFGFPSIVTFNKVQDYKAFDVPPAIVQLYSIESLAREIQESLSTYGKSLLSDALGQRMSLSRLLSSRLDELEAQLEGELNDMTLFNLLAVRVGLYSYYFFRSKDVEPRETQKGFLAAYNASLCLMDHVVKASQRNENFMLYMPQVYVQILWQASVIVARLYYSGWSSLFDKRRGKELYFTVADLLGRASVLEHDVAFRAAEIMTQMWQVFSVMAADKKPAVIDAKVTIGTRGSASVFFDCLWTMRSECEILSQAPTELVHRKSVSGDIHALDKISQHATSAIRQQPLRNRKTTFRQPNPSFSPQQAPATSPHGTLLASTMNHAVSEWKTPPEYSTTDSTTRTPELDWDTREVWKDVDYMMDDFGFQMDDFMRLPGH